MAFKVFLICGTDPSEQVAAWRLQTLATSYGMHVSVPNRNGPMNGGIIDQVRRGIDQSDCVLAIITGKVGPAVATELNYALARGKPIVPFVLEGIVLPQALGKLPVFRFSPFNTAEVETKVMQFLKQQELSKKNTQAIAALVLAGLGIFLLAALAEK
ncbi:MAG TPA: toll/interleukin-1 receptor domain-containing protein [Candidatus Sulfotelmatobacter sp.]|nr:toll/interleukin-1 receptor domain-containing protein [Candidatus Sulfotelmatobacter sp.]